MELPWEHPSAELPSQRQQAAAVQRAECSLTMGTSTYTNAVSMGHQLCQSAQPSNCSSRPRKKAAPSPASLRNAKGQRGRCCMMSEAQQHVGNAQLQLQPRCSPAHTHSRTSLGMAALDSRPSRALPRALSKGGSGKSGERGRQWRRAAASPGTAAGALRTCSALAESLSARGLTLPPTELPLASQAHCCLLISRPRAIWLFRPVISDSRQSR